MNEGHYGFRDVKEKIIEHLAVKILVMNRKPTILIVDDKAVTRNNLEHI